MSKQKTMDMGNGFLDHGPATQVSATRGVVATVDGDGRDVVLVWLYDARGCPALLMIDAETGASTEYPVPIPPGDAPFASVLSSGNRFYSLFNSRFVEFDPVRRAFTFVHDTTPKVGMGMTEDDQGRIWTITYPDSGVVMYDPQRGEFRDYGSVHRENWRQYQRTIAADGTGWIYFAVGNTLTQMIAFDPDTGAATPLLSESERFPGASAYVYRDLDGKVYGLANQNTWDGPWYELYRGNAVKRDAPAPQRHKPIITGLQGLFHRDFPSGRRITNLDLTLRELVVEGPGPQPPKTLHFDYSSEGAHLMGVAAMPDGTMGGGSAFPARFFSYDPGTDSMVDRESYGQPNVLAVQGDRAFIGVYTRGILMEWDTSKPWVTPRKDAPGGNPRFLTECEPIINRPHALLAHPDGRTVVLAGSPGYGYTGGGLLFWDRQTESRVLLEHTELLRDQSTMALVALPEGKLLGGTGTRAGTGGEVKAKEAELYVLDIATKKIEWRAPVFPGAQEYSELRQGPKGLVFGLAMVTPYDPTHMDEAKRFFVFDPRRRTVVYEQKDTEDVFGPIALQQGQRKLVLSDDGILYVLFRKGIAMADPETLKLSWVAKSPVQIDTGGDWSKGRIYFVNGSRLYSYRPP
jgi:hypothetical protein